jgi:Zn-dependent alcohol dehydrogenase
LAGVVERVGDGVNGRAPGDHLLASRKVIGKLVLTVA